MAQHTIVTLIDDTDGTEADATVSFAWGGQAYEIDLSDKNTETWDGILAPLVEKARRITAVRTQARRPGRRVAREESARARAWLEEQPEWKGLGKKGRIPGKALAAWEAAGRPSAAATVPQTHFKQPRL